MSVRELSFGNYPLSLLALTSSAINPKREKRETGKKERKRENSLSSTLLPRSVDPLSRYSHSYTTRRAHVCMDKFSAIQCCCSCVNECTGVILRRLSLISPCFNILYKKPKKRRERDRKERKRENSLSSTLLPRSVDPLSRYSHSYTTARAHVCMDKFSAIQCCCSCVNECTGVILRKLSLISSCFNVLCNKPKKVTFRL
eukprot:sb/3470706/